MLLTKPCYATLLVQALMEDCKRVIRGPVLCWLSALTNNHLQRQRNTFPVPGGPASNIALPAIFLDLINSTTTPAA